MACYFHSSRITSLVCWGLTAVLLLNAQTSLAQQRGAAKKDATVAVDGTVKQIYRSQKQGRNDYVAQVQVERTEARKRLDANAKVGVPVPGDVIYVHLTQKLDGAGRVVAAESHSSIPGEGSIVKVFLAPRESGGWEGTFPDWVEVVKAEAEPANEIFPDETPAPRPAAGGLGLTAETLRVQGRIALRVTAIERGSDAQKSGLEVGDVIVGVNGAELTDPNQIEQLAKKGKPFSVIVVDVNTGKGAQVDIVPGATGAVAPQDPAQPQQPAPAAPKLSLGLSAEEVRIGGRSALKISRVDPNGLGAKAGIEVGDIIVAANGVPTTGPEQLVSALRKSGSKLTLTIRDSRTNKDVNIDIPLGTGKPEKPIAADAGTPAAAGNAGDLGVITELAFHDDEFAVKISEVAEGSPAARAGLKPGLLITHVNGKPVLHPNELNDAIRKSGGKAKITVVEPTSGRSANVDVSTGR